ncbi:hypothetical protein [Shigella dysenteriae]|uniref:hypothetical protein n=1 Tax=Shigella dysenteriae TaxID=622 RepID=UPI00253FF69F|nr:hypothetical protein [Shigella dysenteriae]
MTVSTEVDHNEYTGNGVTTTFPYTFRIFQKSDLVVQVVDLNENITELILDTDYIVTGAGGYSGGNIILSKALANGYQISISRELPVTQDTDLRNQGKFFAEVHEDAFDKLTMLIQQVGSMFRLALRKPSSIANWYDALNNYIRNVRDPRDPQDAATKNYVDGVASSNLSRTLRTPEPIPSLPNAATRANKIIAFDSAGNPYVTMPPSGSATDVFVELAKPTGPTLIGVQPQGNLSQLLIYVTPEQFGAIGDGTAHPLSERYLTLSAAQAVYPFVTSLTQTIDWAACQAAENYARGKCQINVKKNKMYHFGSTDYLEFGQKSAWIAPPLGGFDFTTGFIRSVPSNSSSYQFGQLCIGRVMDSDEAGSSDSAFRDLTIKGLTFKWDTARHVASKGLGTIALHLNMAIKANLDVSMFGAEYACFGYSAWGTQGIIRFDSCHKGVYFDAVSLSPEKDTVGGSTTSHHIELQADHTPFPIYLKNCNYAKFHGWFEGALAQYGNYDSVNETAMGITLDTCSNVTFDMGIEAWEGAHINCIGSVEAEFKLHYLQDSTDGVLIKGLGTQGVANVMRTLMGAADETAIASSNRSLIYVGQFSNISVKHYAPVLSKYTDSTFAPYVVTVDPSSKITFEQCGMHLGGASRLGGASTNLKLAPANYQCIESIGCMYMERYMKANETYDYIRNGYSRHNAWQTKVINAGDGRVQLDAPTGFRIDDYTAHVVASSQSSAGSSAQLAVVSASNAAVLLQTPISASGVSLMYKLTLKVIA